MVIDLRLETMPLAMSRMDKQKLLADIKECHSKGLFAIALLAVYRLCTLNLFLYK